MGVFKRIITLILTTIMLISISGCTFINNIKKTKTENKQNNTETKEENDTAKTITIGIVDLDTYNPIMTKSTTMKSMLGFIFEPLFALDGEQNAVPVLAESYQLAPDGKSIVVNLKNNVMWHDGKSFDVDDVIYTIKTIQNNETAYTPSIQNISSVSKAGEHSVRIEFFRSTCSPENLMTFPIIQKNSASGNFAAIGTGPFYLDYDKLTAFPPYHGNPPAIDNILIESVPDEEKFVSMFNASVLDIADSQMLNMSEYTPRSNAKVNDYTSNEMIFIGFNTNDIVFKHKEARRSIYQILDRQNIVSHIYFSRAKVAHFPINPDNKFYPDSVENVHSDHGRVEKELKDGGWVKDKRGIYFLSDTKSATYFSVEILVNSEDADRIKIASELSDAMKELGLRNSVVTCSDAEFKNRISNGNYDMFIGKTTLLPNNELNELLSGENIFGYSNENTDVFLTLLGTLSLDGDKKNVYEQFFEHLKEESPIVPICFLKKSLVTSAKLKSGVYPSVSGPVIRTENWSVQ